MQYWHNVNIYVYFPFVNQIVFGMEVKIKTHRNEASFYSYITKSSRRDFFLLYIDSKIWFYCYYES